MKCYNCGGEGHFAKECPSGYCSPIQSRKRKEEVVTEISSVTSAEGMDTWPEIVRIPEIGPEVTTDRTGETDTTGITEITETTETETITGVRVLDATTARSTAISPETANLVHFFLQREEAGMLQLWKGRSLRS